VEDALYKLSDRMKKILFITTIILFSILIVKNTQATMCCRMSGGNCICNVTGNCGYICDNGWSNCNNAWGDGCECPQPANCCGGSGNNIKYYGCNICNGANCAVCGVTSCLAQDCNTTNYCSGGACTICSSGLYNDDKNSANGCENAAPQWINALTNSTTPQIRDVISFNVNWTDNTGVNTSLGLGVNFTILSLNGMGPNCDQWANVSNKSWNNVQSLWSNLTWKIPDQCAGKTVAWRQYANDSANRWNVFEQYITIAKGWLNVTLIEPNTKICNETNPCEWCAFFQKDIKAEIECKNYRCGMINATVRRNSTGMTMIPISTSSGDTPFYILETMVRPISYRNSTSGGTITYTFCGGITNPSCGFDDGYNVSTTTRMEIYVSISGYALLDYNYSLNSNSATLFATLSGDDTGFGEYVQIYNFTSNNWYTWITEPDGATTTYGVPVNTTSGLIKSDGTLILRLNTTPTAVGSFPIIDFYDTYVSYISNTISCGNLNVGDSYRVNLTVNATGSSGGYKIGVLFNSSYATVTQNHTNNATIQIPGGNLEVNLDYPPIATTNVDQNSTFTVNATVNCTIASCGNVYGTVRYNASSANPDTNINSTVGATPFYNTSGAILQSCGSMSQGQSCQLNWTINATGNFITGYKIGVLFNTSYNQNHTDNATINIIECTEDSNIGWSSIDFGNLQPNTQGGQALLNPSNFYNITNKGTCTLKIWIKGTYLENTTLPSPNRIEVGNLTWSNTSNGYGNSYNMTTSYVLLNSSFTPSIKNITTYYWLSVPPIYAGGYNGTLYICENTTQNSGSISTCT
jgi:hypothetical protein